MVNTLSGSVCAYRKETVKPRFIRIDEVMALLDVTQDEAMDIALAAGARYQLAKIILVHKERLISFNSDGTTTFFAQLEKSSASQKEYLEKLQEKKAAEKKEVKKKEQSKQTEVRKTTVQANSKEELLDKIKNIDWDSIKPEENKIGGRFDFSI